MVFQYDELNRNTIFSSEHTSYDNGKTWQKNEYFLLAVSKKNPLKMLGRKAVGEAYELWYTEDGGKNWRYLTAGRKDNGP